MTKDERRAAMIEGGKLVIDVFIKGFGLPENSERMRAQLSRDFEDLVDQHLADPDEIAADIEALAAKEREPLAALLSLLDPIIAELDKGDGDEGAVLRYLEPELRAAIAAAKRERA